MKHLFLFLAGLLMCSQISLAQKSLSWELLSDVEFTDEYLTEIGTQYPVASFSKEIRKMEGEQVMLIGYLLPVAVGSDEYVLSANPFATCFFCGKSGPETVIELNLARSEKWFAMDQLVMFEGVLRLNEKDPEHLYFILDGAIALERMDK